MTVSYSDDADAAWLRKGNRIRYGYKIHAATDSRDGFLLGGHVTPANRSDTQEFIDLLDEIRPMAGGCVYADKGYSSQLNRHVLQIRGLTDSIMLKAVRNRALSAAEKAVNRLISSVRAKVERVLRHTQTVIRILPDALFGDAQGRVGISTQCHGLQPEKGSPQGGMLRTFAPQRR